MSILSLWVVFGLLAAFCRAAFMLVQERYKVSGLSISYWNKVFMLLFSLPLALYFGFPDNPKFYMIVAAQAVLWTISDIILFDNVGKSGAGLISRITPLGMILTFILWLPFDPNLTEKYAENPIITTGIIGSLLMAGFFAYKKTQCKISMEAIKSVWFVIMAALIGPIMIKLATNEADTSAHASAYVAFEAVMMLLYWSVYMGVFRTKIPKDFITKKAISAGARIGFFCTLAVICNVSAVYYAPNPVYAKAMMLNIPVFILIYYKIRGVREESNVWAGMGLVASAALLILIESFMP